MTKSSVAGLTVEVEGGPRADRKEPDPSVLLVRLMLLLPADLEEPEPLVLRAEAEAGKALEPAPVYQHRLVSLAEEVECLANRSGRQDSVT